MSLDVNKLEESTKRALHAFLSGYFDGGAHRIGGADPVTVPAADIRFNRQQFPQALTKPMIILQRGRPGRDRKWAAARGYDIRTIGHWRFNVVTTNAEKSWRQNDLVQDCLGMIFRTAGFVLARSGIRTLNISDPQPVFDTHHEYQVSARDIEFLIDLSYEFAGERFAAPMRGGVA
ncbi:MAG: hypothetical protein KIS92_22460 [Planctomycetota bacterium]|nr:hypothetical protein [Planctomycetota bacterium]